MPASDEREDRPPTRPRMRRERLWLQAVLDTIPLGIFIVEGPEATISYLNPRAQELHGFDSLGRSLEEAVGMLSPTAPDGSPCPMETMPVYRALHGEHVRNDEIILRRPDGSRFPVTASASPLPQDEGWPHAAVSVFDDVTGRKRREEALRKSEERLQRELGTTRILLQTASDLAGWTDLQSVLYAFTQAVVSATSHTRATFALWDEIRRMVQTVASSGLEPIPPFSAPLEAFSPPFQQVAESKETMIADYDDMGAEQKRMADAVHSHKGLLVPMTFRRRLVGGLFVDDPGARGDFPEEEIGLIQGIAAQAAVAVENARLYEAQCNIASTLQQALLALPTEIPGLHFSHLYRSATEEAAIGGDFYDLIQVRDEEYIILIGDVSGHGIEAARSATFVRHAVAAFASEEKTAAEILWDTNQALLRRGVSDFVSTLLGHISPDRRRLLFCSAGHPNFVLRREGGSTTLVGTTNSPPLGVFTDWSCHMEETELSPGDLLVFYTDGLTEARKGDELFGEQRLLDWVSRERGVLLADLPSALLREVLSFTGGGLQDDVAILAIEIDREAG